MSKLTIPHNAFVFVGDGGKALFLRNEGDEKFPNLVIERVFAEEIRRPANREQTPPAAPSPAPTRSVRALSR